MRNRVPTPALDRGKKETVGHKTCGGNWYKEAEIIDKEAEIIIIKRSAL